MNKLRVTHDTIIRASKKMLGEVPRNEQTKPFVPSYRLPAFEYSKDKVEAAWSKAFVNHTQRS